MQKKTEFPETIIQEKRVFPEWYEEIIKKKLTLDWKNKEHVREVIYGEHYDHFQAWSKKNSKTNPGKDDYRRWMGYQRRKVEKSFQRWLKFHDLDAGAATDDRIRWKEFKNDLEHGRWNGQEGPENLDSVVFESQPDSEEEPQTTVTPDKHQVSLPTITEEGHAANSENADGVEAAEPLVSGDRSKPQSSPNPSKGHDADESKKHLRTGTLAPLDRSPGNGNVTEAGTFRRLASASQPETANWTPALLTAGAGSVLPLACLIYFGSRFMRCSKRQCETHDVENPAVPEPNG